LIILTKRGIKKANDKMKKGSKTVDPIKSKREIQAVKNYLSGKNLRDYTIFVVGRVFLPNPSKRGNKDYFKKCTL
jgi:hypothetical protein